MTNEIIFNALDYLNDNFKEVFKRSNILYVNSIYYIPSSLSGGAFLIKTIYLNSIYKDKLEKSANYRNKFEKYLNDHLKEKFGFEFIPVHYEFN